jgi:hypothetical protein
MILWCGETSGFCFTNLCAARIVVIFDLLVARRYAGET